jgi:hypothetical protein
MDRWLIPAAIVLIVLAIVFPVLMIVYGALVGLVGLSVLYNKARLPGPYLSLLDEGAGLRVNWLCSNKASSTSRVVITKDGSVVKAIPPDGVARNPLGSNFTILSAPIAGLEPGEAYNYRIEALRERGSARAARGGRGNRFIFPSRDRLPIVENTRIAALGDMQPKGIMPPLLQYLIMKKIQRYKPDLVIFLGDHTNTGNDARAWLWYLRLIGIVARNTPVLGTPGNHDSMRKNTGSSTSGDEAYSKFVNYPGNRRHYMVKHAGIHLISLDYQEPTAPGTPQHRFLTDGFQKNSPADDEWLLMFSHETPYNTAIRPDDIPASIIEMRNYVKPLVEKYRVMWLGGHEHAYQKFTVDGVHYITTAATSSFHDHDYSREHMDLNVKKFHFVLIDAGTRKMRVRAIPLSGKIIDEFSIESSIADKKKE